MLIQHPDITKLSELTQMIRTSGFESSVMKSRLDTLDVVKKLLSSGFDTYFSRLSWYIGTSTWNLYCQNIPQELVDVFQLLGTLENQKALSVVDTFYVGNLLMIVNLNKIGNCITIGDNPLASEYDKVVSLLAFIKLHNLKVDVDPVKKWIDTKEKLIKIAKQLI